MGLLWKVSFYVINDYKPLAVTYACKPPQRIFCGDRGARWKNSQNWQAAEKDGISEGPSFIAAFFDGLPQHLPTSPGCQLRHSSTFNAFDMSKSTALRVFRSLTSTVCASCRCHQVLRPFSQTTTRAKGAEDLDAIFSNISQNRQSHTDPAWYTNMIPGGSPDALRNLASKDWPVDDMHKLHIYSHKHNTHITLAKPNHDSLISVSCGNIGFRKAARKTFDAAYQLAAFTMARIQDKGLMPQIEKLELVYRGFGPGREAVTKAILSSEGKRIRPLIVKVSDSTRLKFGGVRSRKPKRLG